MKTMWLVEDDKIQQFILKRVVTPFLDYLFIFNNGLEALTTLQEKLKNNETLPNLILLDINMPIMDGWDFLDRFTELKKQINIEIPVYMFTSSINSSDIEHAKKYYSVQGYLIKPCNADTLKEIISKAV